MIESVKIVSALIAGAYELGKDAPRNEPGTVRVDAGALDALLYDLSKAHDAESFEIPEEMACAYFNDRKGCETCRAFDDSDEPCVRHMVADVRKRIYKALQ